MLNLKAPLASSLFRPIARSTCEGSIEPAAHAEPLDAHIPFMSSIISKESPETSLKQKCILDGRRFRLHTGEQHAETALTSALASIQGPSKVTSGISPRILSTI